MTIIDFVSRRTQTTNTSSTIDIDNHDDESSCHIENHPLDH